MSHAPAAGLQRIGRYRIVRPLSKGGMALVYEARRESLAGVSPRVALKIILPEHASSETFRELFINEARLGASMRHQNLVQIQDFDSEGDTYFLVMEYVEGLTLRRVISATERSGRKLPLSVIAELGRQACDGLQYAHTATDEQGKPLQLVHRDIKPSNLIVSPTGILKVLDFGISKGRLREERKGSVKGTWGYMAPEQAMGLEVGPSSDVFGLAVVLYELASLRPMFSQDQAKDEMRRLLKDDHAARMAATLDSAYGPLVGVLVRALQRDPAARYESAEAFGRALSALLPDPITARDELVRFAADIEAMDKPRPRAIATDEAPSEPVRKRRPLPPAVGNALSVGVGALVSFTLLLGLGVGTLSLLQDPSRDVVLEGEVPATAMAAVPPAEGAAPVPTTPAPLLAQDEPPGPAGVGAPGERRGVPLARPRIGTRRPPSSSRRAQHLASEASPSAAEEIAAAPVVEEPVTIAVIRPKPPPTEPSAQPVAPVAPVVEEPRDPGTVMVGSRQAAEVWVDGSFVAQAPVEQLLPAGRHEIVLVAADGRRRAFDVEVQPGGRVKRVWDFDRMEWR
ncbi:MAG: protein kinase [Alphaproteobacteria bacterium]|nr:protein kinase [Alphaproteobacteria bacterium]MCB9696182.1 protein kinase [Alphaproteobacteria bacterium]